MFYFTKNNLFTLFSLRCIKLVKSDSDDSKCALVTASNDGLVKVWSVDKTDSGTFDVEEAAKVNTKCRITCLTVHKVPEVQQTQQTKTKDSSADLLASVKESLSKTKKRKSVRMAEEDEDGDKEKQPKLTIEYENDDDDEEGGEDDAESKKSGKKRRKKKNKRNSAGNRAVVK